MSEEGARPRAEGAALIVSVAMRGEPVLVVGGGSVASRKARRLLDAGAIVRVIAFEVVDDRLRACIERGEIAWEARGFVASDLVGARMVWAATSDEDENARIARDARAAGILVNSATHNEDANLWMMARAKRDNLQVGVSSGGHAPALARAFADRIQRLLDDEPQWSIALFWLERVRPVVKEVGEQRARARALADVTDALVSLARDRGELDWREVHALTMKAARARGLKLDEQRLIDALSE